MYPGDPGLPGSDFAGVVASGPGAGGAVFGLTTGALASHAACSARTLAPLPPAATFEAGAAAPTVRLTVATALRQLARVRPGEAVLVHGAAGGVGLAAVAEALASGCTPLGTAGAPAKRAFVRAAGARGVAASRDTGFAADLAVATASRGADVVLNSLTSPGMVAASLALLRRGGRLVEIGKRDVWSGATVAAQRPDVSYSLLAVDFLPEPVLQGLLLQLSSDLATGRAPPLRAAVHGMHAAVTALRQMAVARHVGKVVVSVAAGASGGGGGAAAAPAAPDGLAGGAVAMTGGTGALGCLAAGWLAQQGAARILLTGRSGRAPPHAGGGALPLADPNHPLFAACVTFVACDGAAAADADALFAFACGGGARGGPPLRALLHAGGVLADAALANQGLAGLRRVAAPKAHALDALTARLLRTHPAAQTLLFSSVAALLGNPGQANYAAANAALDAAAAALGGSGLPARSVQWGAWAGAGMAVATAGKVEAMGIGALRPAEGLHALEVALGACSGPRWAVGLRLTAVMVGAGSQAVWCPC
jgi:NADPH:quinone reductase-like Zn-dependent oxidoreductase